MFHFSRNIISASFGEGYINLNPLSAASTPPRKTPGRILLFLSNHFVSIFWCQDPSWLTSAGSIWAPLSPCFFSVSPWHLTDKYVVQCVCRKGFRISPDDTQAIRQRSRSAVPAVAVYLINVFFLFYIMIEEIMPADLCIWWHFWDSCLFTAKRKTASWGNVRCQRCH